MKVVVLSDATEVGGAEVALRTLLTAIGSTAHIELLCSSTGVEEYFSGIVRTARVPGIGSHTPSLGLVRVLRAADPDVVHLNMNSAFSCRGGQLSAHLARIPVSGTEHSPQFHGKTAGHAIFRKRIMSSWLKAHVCVGDRMGRQIERTARLPSNSLVTIYNGVAPVERVRKEGTGTKRVGTMGRLDRGKRIDMIIRSLKFCDQRVELHVVGSGEQREYLHELAKTLGLSGRVVFTEPGFGESAREALSQLDLFLMASELEGLSLVLVEAALAGVPAIATDVGSCREAVIDGVTGQILSPGASPADFGQAIDHLLSQPEVLSDYAERGREFASERFAPERMAEAYLELWERTSSTT